VVEAI